MRETWHASCTAARHDADRNLINTRAVPVRVQLFTKPFSVCIAGQNSRMCSGHAYAHRLGAVIGFRELLGVEDRDVHGGTA